MLDEIRSPKDLQGLSRGQLKKLAEEIRSFLIDTVS
ncbi:MAG: 1-deoxy-D-xylulose-5-phosphate synthase N-terminal domain-containing protein, partial [Aquiluna sp.]